MYKEERSKFHAKRIGARGRGLLGSRLRYRDLSKKKRFVFAYFR
jgi:hypothetical protein